MDNSPSSHVAFLTEDLFNKFIKTILLEKESVSKIDEDILKLFPLFDPNENKYHIEYSDFTIWPIAAWKINEKRILRQREESRIFNEKLFKRKELTESLTIAIMSKLTISREMAELVVRPMIANDMPKDAGVFFGVDLSEWPKLDKPHYVI